MTVSGYGLKVVEFIRERDSLGEIDREYVGRKIRLVPESGGEIVLRLTPSELGVLSQACEEEMKRQPLKCRR